MKSFFKKIKNFFYNPQKNKEEEIKKSTKKERSYLDYDWTPVIEFETGGKNYYDKFLKKMIWPKGESGITMGIGADLGYMTKEEFDQFFSKYFTQEEIKYIEPVIGLKGKRASDALPRVKHIELSWSNAYKAFVEWTLPKFWKMTQNLWPEFDKLHEKAQIALVSIVFNRGSSTKGPTRTEMLNIKPLVLKKDYKGIAQEIRNMKRLWVGKGLVGLLKRRDAEAKMVEDCA